MLKTLEEYTQYPVDKIVFSHSGNPDPLEPGTQENVKFVIQYVKVKDWLELIRIFNHLEFWLMAYVSVCKNLIVDKK